jgi:hypothetical protein
MTHKVDWLSRDQDDVFEWSNMSVYLRTGFFFSEHYKNQAKRVVPVQSGHHLIEYDLFSS